MIEMSIAGDGPELDNVKRLVKSNNYQDIEFLGYVSQDRKREALLKSHIYLFPTFHREGMPTSVLEAMCTGLPVITRSVGGIKDFVINNQMGFITQSKDPVEIAQLCEKLITDTRLRTKIAIHNFHYATKNFLASRIAEKLEKIYYSTLNN